MDSDLWHLEEQLRRSRPRPDERFVADLEERLLPRPAPSARRRFACRPLVAAAAVTSALAVAVVGFGIAGGGPLAPSGGEGASAGDDCAFVPVRKRVRTPVVVSDRQGRSEIRYRSKVVTEKVKRCR